MPARSIAARFLFSTLLLGAAGASFAVDSVTFENYAPASSVTRQTFSGIGSATPEVDVEFYTFIEKPGHRESRLKAEGAGMEEAQGYLHIYLHKGETAISLK